MNNRCFRGSKWFTAPNGLKYVKKNTKKSVLCAVMAGVVACGGAANAATLDEVDLTQIPLDKPTLDYLHENNVTMPPELDGDGNVIEGTDNIIYPESGYTLKEVENADPENLPDNTITKYELNEVTKYYHPQTGAEVAADTLEAGVEYKQVTIPQANQKYYTVGLDKTNFGTGDTSRAFSVNVMDKSYTINTNWYKADEILERSSLSASTESIVGTYIDKKVTAGNAFGGAIVISGSNVNIDKISGVFINNSAVASSTAGGAAIAFNNGNATVNSIEGLFVGNISEGKASEGLGGAISLLGKHRINEIKGDFIANGVLTYKIPGSGGAINSYYWSGSNISAGNVIGNFIGNYVKSSSAQGGSGGAIAYLIIDNLVGDFIGNYVELTNEKSGATGGAIFGARVNNITGDFIDNHIITNNNAYGGAITVINIGTLNGDFINNYIKHVGTSATDKLVGGAISNGGDGVTTTINGNYIRNHIDSIPSVATYGGAIHNGGIISEINANFIGNYISNGGESYGGAINNFNQLDRITGNFVANYINANGIAYGGAIYNSGTIKDITGNFIGNYAQSTDSTSLGGAIHNSGIITSVTGDFVSNSANSFGGAIMNNTNSSHIGFIKGDFIGNNLQHDSFDMLWGGALYNEGIIDDINGNFIGNFIHPKSKSSESGHLGGAIFNCGTMGNVNGNFINNYISSNSEGEGVYGGAIYNSNNIGKIIGDFLGNHIGQKSFFAHGGAIYNCSAIDDISGAFVENSVTSNSSYGGSALGGAIYNTGTIGAKDADGNIIGGIINSSFINNYAKSEFSTAQGGAIWTNKDLNLIAQDGYTSVFEGNYTESNGVKDNNAIYLSGATLNFDMLNGGSFALKDNIQANIATPLSFYERYGATNLDEYAKTQGYKDKNYDTMLSFQGYVSLEQYLRIDEGGMTVDEFLETYGYDSLEQWAELNGVIDGTPAEQLLHRYGCKTEEDFLKTQGIVVSTVNIKGDDINNTTFYLLNDIYDANVSFANTTINTINNDVHTYNFNKLTLNADTNFVADVDLANKTMDRFTATSYGEHQGNLNVVGMNLLSDAIEGETLTAVYFAQPGLKNNVLNGVSSGTGELPDSNYQTELYTPIYKYKVAYDNVNQYDNKGDGGYFVFAKGDRIIQQTPQGGVSDGGSTGNPSNAFNPAVLGSPVAAQTGAMATVGQAFNYAFQNSDNFMTIPYLERVAMKNANRYALSPTGDATDVGTFSPLFTQQDHSSVWVKPYATFENVPLKNGPKVSNITYGTLVGFDGEMQHLKRGWDRVWTGYIGYNGASQRYSGVDSTQNGGLVGATMTMYKGHFFNATTLSVGASLAENTNMYGKEDFTMLLGGIANKSGYNFEFKEGKVILQPSMLISYTFVNTFDYNNAAGVKIETKPLHALQLAPGLKLIGNIKGGWQPYASVNMVWNLMGKSDVTANGVKLPEMSLKPYVQYGVGVQKRIKDRAMAYGQAMIQNGGRNGISLSGGFRWALGKEGKPIEKVSCPQQKCAKAKKLVPVFVMGNGEKIKIKTNKNVTKPAETNTKKVLKQMTPMQKSRLMNKSKIDLAKIGVIK